MADPKIVARIEKLLRLAAPTSGTNEAERSSAALEAAKLIAEHGVPVGQPAPPPSPRRAPPQRRQPFTYPVPQRGDYYSPRPPTYADYRPPSFTGAGDWGRSVATRDDLPCADPDCRVIIRRGEPVWVRIKGGAPEYLHCGGPCGW